MALLLAFLASRVLANFFLVSLVLNYKFNVLEKRNHIHFLYLKEKFLKESSFSDCYFRMSISSNSRELSRLRGRPLYSFVYGVNHQVGRSFISLDIQVNFLIDPESVLFAAPRRLLSPVLRFLRRINESQFRDIFDLYQLVSLFQSREVLSRGVYADLLESDPLQGLLSSSDFMSLIYSRTPFDRVASYYAEFEDDRLGDSFELFLSLA